MRRIAISFLVLCAALFGAQHQPSAFTKSGAGCATPGLNVSIGFCGSGGGASLTFTVAGTNNAGSYSGGPAAAIVCPSSTFKVAGSASTDFNIGSATGTRVAVVGFSYSPAAALPNGQITGVMFGGTPSGGSCTGGTAASPAADGYGVGSSNANSSIWYAALPSGTTTSVCFTAVGGNGWLQEGVVTVGYLTGSATASVSSTVTASPPSYPGSCSGGTCTNSGSVMIASGGVAVMAAVTADGSFPSSSWTNATKDIESNDGSGNVGAMAHATATNTVTETVVTGDASGWVSASFQP
jgi:hypothetical protein